MIKNNVNWSNEPGFSDLSEGAQKIGLYAEGHGGAISGVFKEDPGLIDSLDEFHHWSAVVVAQISGKSVTTETGHSIKNNLVKK